MYNTLKHWFSKLQSTPSIQLSSAAVPKHIAIIPDGNRRWAKKSLLNPLKGHLRGADNVLNIVKKAQEIGVEVVTLYTFSTENWRRPEIEIKGLFQLLEKTLLSQLDQMLAQHIRFHTIGDLSPLPESTQRIIQATKETTKSCYKMNLVLAVNYGGRDEIKRTFQKMWKDVSIGKLNPSSLTESDIQCYLDTSEWGDPELLIRTSGEARISNFLLWQLSYSEIYLTSKLWPEFTEDDLVQAVAEYQHRQKRLGR